MCVCAACFMCTTACSTHRGQKRVGDPMELELQAVVNCLVWVVGTKRGFSEASALNLWATSLRTYFIFNYVYVCVLVRVLLLWRDTVTMVNSLFKKKYYLFYFMYIGVLPACMYVWAAMWVLGIESGSTGRAASALSLWGISPAHVATLIKESISLGLAFSSEV
jgi:hypothetical protein